MFWDAGDITERDWGKTLLKPQFLAILIYFKRKFLFCMTFIMCTYISEVNMGIDKPMYTFRIWIQVVLIDKYAQ